MRFVVKRFKVILFFESTFSKIQFLHFILFLVLFLLIRACPSVCRLKRRDLGSCSHFPCRAELFGWFATSLAEGLLAGVTSKQVPQTSKNTATRLIITGSEGHHNS